MKFIIPQKEFAAAVASVRQAVTAKAVMPALKCILLDVNGTTLTLTATDLNITIQHSVEISGNENGTALVDARLLNDIVSKLPNALVNVSTNATTVTISALTSEFNISKYNTADYPNLPNVGDSASFSVRCDALKALVRNTAFAASVDEKRGVLCGCLLDIGDDCANMVALDGFRLAMAHEDVTVNGRHSAIVPASHLSRVVAIIKEDDAEVTVGVTENFVKFDFGSTTVTSRLLSGQFVRYADIIPKSFTTTISVSADDLASALERANLFAKEGKNSLVKFDIDDTGVMYITSRGNDGAVREELNVDFDGAPIVIGFNAKYILDALKAIPDDEVRMAFTSPNSASLITPADGDAFTHMILPVRLAKEA